MLAAVVHRDGAAELAMSGDHMVSVMNVIGLVLVMLGIFMVVVAMPEQHTFLAVMALRWRPRRRIDRCDGS